MINYKVIKVDGAYRILNLTHDVTLSDSFETEEDANAFIAMEREWKQELAMERGMAFGIRAYNETLGYDSYSPEEWDLGPEDYYGSD